MLYEGDDEIDHKKDTSKANDAQIEIKFDETYYANIYDEVSPCGLGIIRADKTPFSLRRLYTSKETILMPYMKKCTE